MIVAFVHGSKELFEVDKMVHGGSCAKLYEARDQKTGGKLNLADEGLS